VIQLSNQLIRRYVRDFLTHHLVRLRKSKELIILAEEGDSLRLSQSSLSIDSVELVYLSGLFADAVGLRHYQLEDLLLASPSVEGWAELLERALHSGLPQWGFYTSGTEGKPKLIMHPLAHLIEEVSFLAEHFLTFGIERVVSLVPSHHIYGFLWSILFPQLFQKDVVHSRPNFSQFQNKDLILTTPFLIKLWKDRELLPPENSLILVSTAPFEPELAEWLDLNERRWLEIYGSTETAGIGFRQRASDGFELFPYWKVNDSPNDGTFLIRNGTSHPLPDQVDVKGNTIRPLGRRDGALAIGGVNVYPQRVQRLLESFPGVAQAFVRTCERDDGLRLKAWIVPEPNQDMNYLEKTLRDYCSKNLLSVEQPVRFTFGDQPPFNAYGKLQDW